MRSAAPPAQWQQMIAKNEVTGQTGAATAQVAVERLDGCQITHAATEDFALATLPVFGEMLAQADNGNIPPLETPDLADFE